MLVRRVHEPDAPRACYALELAAGPARARARSGSGSAPARCGGDVGHGGGSFDFTIFEAALQQGLLPDTISSDVHAFSVNTPGMPFLPWVMSKFLLWACRLSKLSRWRR